MIIRIQSSILVQRVTAFTGKLLLQESSFIESMWESSRDKNYRVEWFRLVWCPPHVPRHSFIAW
jgi:hypothetical protein